MTKENSVCEVKLIRRGHTQIVGRRRMGIAAKSPRPRVRLLLVLRVMVPCPKKSLTLARSSEARCRRALRRTQGVELLITINLDLRRQSTLFRAIGTSIWATNTTNNEREGGMTDKAKIQFQCFWSFV